MLLDLPPRAAPLKACLTLVIFYCILGIGCPCHATTISTTVDMNCLQVLCGGTREEKMLSIFNLFHHGERGGITVGDIATYTTSAFRAMYKLQPSLEGEVRSVHYVLRAARGLP